MKTDSNTSHRHNMDLVFVRLILLLELCAISSVSAQCSTNKYGEGCRFDCHCAPDVTCDSNTGCTDNTKCADGWDGPTCQRQNVARGCKTSQSSTWTNKSSVNAVDGKSGHSLGLPCTHTDDGDLTPSWRVTLNQTYDIYRFRIYNRREWRGFRLNGFTLSVRTTTGAYITCYRDSITDSAGPGDIVDGSCQTPISGDLVKIDIPTPHLTLCEVLLYVCSDCTYGENCDKYCGKCWNKNLCDKISGICPLINGNTRCAAGYRGDKCDQDCEVGFWGEDCANQCGQCSVANNCNNVNGVCLPNSENVRCAPKFKGDKCEDCDAGHWGEHCRNKCGQCWLAEGCNKQNGVCPLTNGNERCAAGFRGELCFIGCSPGTHGPNCVLTCSTNCIEGPTGCSIYTGKCNGGCAPGFAGDYCTAPDSSNDTALIVGIVTGVVLLVLIVVIIFMYMRKSRREPTNSSSFSGEAQPTDPARRQDITMETISREIDTRDVEVKDANDYEHISEHEYEKIRVQRSTKMFRFN